MDFAEIIAFVAAVAAIGIAVGTAFSARTATHWAFVTGMGLLGLESLMVGWSREALMPAEAALWQQLRLAVLSVIPGVWLLFSLSYGREKARDWLKRTAWIWGPALVVPVLSAAGFWRHLISGIAAPTAYAPWVISLGRMGMLVETWVLLGAILVLMNLERTYRAAVGTMRWRIKFMVVGVGGLFVLRAFTASQAILFRSVQVSLQTLNSSALMLACVLIVRTLLRTGHFEVKVYASETVLHKSLTVFVGGIYLVIVGAAASLIGDVSGDSEFQLKAFFVMVALVGLSVLLFSDRARLLSRRFISRHFERPMHDYRAVWRTFTERTVRCVDEAGLCTAIVNLVSEVFQALSVGMWVVEDGRRKLKLAASTSIPTTKAKGKWIEGEEAAEILRALAGKEEPIDIDASQDKWAAALRRAYPSEFPRGGSRVCVPVKSGKEVAGCMVVADRVGGIKYSLQDLELLKAIGDQLAASLVNLQLSDRLAQAKQLEAFQAMSAFFVHDLKNAASRLALMLKNFPVHYEKPEFREDAVRGIGKTVTHLNDLIARLNMLRHELQVHAVECDLNKLLTTLLLNYEAGYEAKSTPAVSGEDLISGGGNGVEIVKELGVIPKVRLDPAQIEKVITNLVLNARDAVGGRGGGRIRIQTARRHGWVILGVWDNGCGMTAEFIRDSLFRPFRSTKKEGMGIGMFHCKMIVEAHRGQIEVESELGKGTEFRVLLPAE